MAEQLLNRSDVIAGFQEMRGEAVPQGLNTLLINRILRASITAITRSTTSR